MAKAEYSFECDQNQWGHRGCGVQSGRASNDGIHGFWSHAIPFGTYCPKYSYRDHHAHTIAYHLGRDTLVTLRHREPSHIISARIFFRAMESTVARYCPR